MQRIEGEPEAKIRFGYHRAMYKEVSGKKLDELLSLYRDVDQYYQDHPEEIDKMLADPAAAFEVPEEEDMEEGEDMEKEIDMEVPEAEPVENRWPCKGDDCRELATLTVVANTIMNLDEFITKE
jgi:hypothetical protein